MTPALVVARSWRRIAIVAAIAAGALAPSVAQARPPAGLRVVGGTPADAAQFPYVVKLVSRDGLCTGSLIAPDRVLTAAHCMSGFVIGDKVLVGGAVTRRILHMAQDPRLTALKDAGRLAVAGIPFDVAIFQLDAPISEIAPIRLAQPADAPLYAPGALLTTVGFGSTDRAGHRGGGVLRFAQVQAQSDGDCKARVGRIFVSAYMLCTIDPDSAAPYRSACFGDSGGPLVALAPNGTLAQVGIDDFGLACGFRGGDPESYVEVASIADFALSPAPVYQPEPLGRPRLTGTAKVGRRVRCSTPAYNDPQPDAIVHAFYSLSPAGTARLVALARSYRIGRSLRGRRLVCEVLAHSAGGVTYTDSAIKRVSRRG
jgi:trypsin